ncbi:MAG: hypothetical protein QXF55_02765 [Candidatus Aenigmatarchaeota archaeon]
MVNGLDVGSLLFREILRMYEYPGAPFTGELVRDLVLFFFVPTVFIIMVIFFATSIVMGPAWRGMRLLFGIAAYLFIIVSGYYPIFAYIAGPYFFFLIIVLGLLFFLLRHFRRPTLREGGGGGAAPAPGAPVGMPAEALRATQASWFELKRRLKEVEDDLARAKERLAQAHAAKTDPEAAFWAQEVARLEREKRELEKHMRILPRL